ncbi:hypothetical protein [Streptomyces sp. NPDC101393]
MAAPRHRRFAEPRTVAMALIMDWLGTLVELLLHPRGLEVD